MVINKADRSLGIRFGTEPITKPRKAFPQLRVVFDDTVMNGIHKLRPVRMGIFVGRRAVRSPARMTDSGMR